jgi:hypothetical protein
VAVSKEGEKQKKRNLVEGRWREDLDPFIAPLTVNNHTTF